MEEYVDTDELTDFLRECREKRTLIVKARAKMTFPALQIDRFHTLTEIRQWVQEGQESEESLLFDNWPLWKYLRFVLDDKKVLKMEQEGKLVVWDLLENGHEIWVMEKHPPGCVGDRVTTQESV